MRKRKESGLTRERIRKRSGNAIENPFIQPLLHSHFSFLAMENIFFVGSRELLREFVNGFQLPRKYLFGTSITSGVSMRLCVWILESHANNWLQKPWTNHWKRTRMSIWLVHEVIEVVIQLQLHKEKEKKINGWSWIKWNSFPPPHRNYLAKEKRRWKMVCPGQTFLLWFGRQLSH